MNNYYPPEKFFFFFAKDITDFQGWKKPDGKMFFFWGSKIKKIQRKISSLRLQKAQKSSFFVQNYLILFQNS